MKTRNNDPKSVQDLIHELNTKYKVEFTLDEKKAAMKLFDGHKKKCLRKYEPIKQEDVNKQEYKP